MALIKLSKRNQAGQDVGTVFINTDHIVAIADGEQATEVQTADTRTHWVKETTDQVVALVKA